jgi:hypothetical protein
LTPQTSRTVPLEPFLSLTFPGFQPPIVVEGRLLAGMTALTRGVAENVIPANAGILGR